MGADPVDVTEGIDEAAELAVNIYKCKTTKSVDGETICLEYEDRLARFVADIHIDYVTEAVEAEAGVDYGEAGAFEEVAGTVTVEGGFDTDSHTGSAPLTIPIIDDRLHEENESFSIVFLAGFSEEPGSERPGKRQAEPAPGQACRDDRQRRPAGIVHPA